MKISKSKQELARIISENGGWRDGAEWSIQDRDKNIEFMTRRPEYMKSVGAWYAYASRIGSFKIDNLLPNFHQTILSRAEYFHLYPAPGDDGWIEWKGGECPVEKGALVDVIWRSGIERVGVKALHIGGAGHQFWVADGMVNDIIAYRPHNPEQAKPEFCESVIRSIPEPEINSKNIDITQVDDIGVVESKPTIEQLASDYHAKLAIATQAQEEADSHRCGAEVALSKLEIAAKELGFKIETITAKQEYEMVITDWRDLQVGDVIELTGSENPCWKEHSVS